MTTALARIQAWQDAADAGRAVTTDDGLVLAVQEDDGTGTADPGCSYRYDARGELTAIIEADGTCWEYHYGGDGRLLAVNRDGQRHATYRYDTAGRLTAVDGPAGARIHRYDDAGRLVRSGPAGAFAYRYDPQGRVVAARCAVEETRFAYDPQGRVTRVEQTAEGVTLEAVFTFDVGGRLARVAFPRWGMAVGYTWDAQGRPASLTWRGAEPGEEQLVARYGYREGDAGTLAWAETADGVREETWHDPMGGRPVRTLLRHGTQVRWELRREYGPEGRLRREGARTYGYDQLGRLAGAVEGGLRWRFRYDSLDELVEEDGPAPRPQDVVVDAADRVRRVRHGDTQRTYRYDDAGQLREVLEDGRRLARFRYDHKGRLLSKDTPAGCERYLYGPDDGLLAVADETGAPRVVFLRQPTGQVGMVDCRRPAGGQVVVFHDDGRGNLVWAGRAGGCLEGPFRADPFGVPLDASDEEVPYLHHGRVYHRDVGLYRLGGRWYAPALRRFLTPDTYTGAPDDERLVNPFVVASAQRATRAQILGAWLEQPRVRNRHAYCANDPVNRVDPNGHWSFGGALLSLLGAIWALPNTLIGLLLEVSCLVGEVIRWLAWLCSGGSVTWQTPGFDVAASGRLNAFALVFTGGWLGSFESLLGITFGNVFFVNREWRNHPDFAALPAQVPVPAEPGVTNPRDDVLYEHELRHVNQYSWFGPFFHVGLPLWGVYLWDVILSGSYWDAWTERDARNHSGFPQ